MRRKFTIIAAVLLFLSAGTAYAYSGRYMVTTREGLTNSSINHIFQDSHGLMWISTWDGLNVYNGNSMRTYRSDPGNASTLLDNIVWYTVQEDERYYWVVTDWGVSRLDSKTGLFRRYRLGSGDENPMAWAGISMDISETGEMFFSSKGWGMVVYDKEGDRMVPFNISGLSASNVSAIYCKGSDRMLVCLVDGSVVSVYYTIKDYGNIEASVEDELIPAQEAIRYSSEHGEFVYFFGEEKAYRWHINDGTYDTVPFQGGSVSYSDVDRNGSIYVLTDRNSVYELDFDAAVTRYAPELSRNNLLGLCFGSEGVIWLAIDGVGLEVTYGIESPLKLFENKEIFGSKSASVTSLVQAVDGDIYVSTLGNGLFVLDEKGVFKHKITDDAVYSDLIFSMGEGPEETLILGSTGSIGVRSVRDGISYPLIDLHVVAYCQYFDSKRNVLWTGSIGDGIFRLNLEKNPSGRYGVSSYEQYQHKNGDENSLSSNNVMHIAPCGEDHLWVGTLGGGLSRFDIETGRCVSYSSAYGDEVNDNVRFILPEDDGSIWAGTSYGIYRGEPDSDGGMSFRSYNENHGLEDNTIHSIMKDSSGMLWLSTNSGLSMFDPVKETFTNYNAQELLQSEEFYIHSCLTTSDGEMYFGGVAGLNHFKPEAMRLRDFSPKIHFENFTVRLDSRDVPFSGETIVLKHDENFFNIGFSAIEYIGNANCEYAYKLEGFNEDWVTVGGGTATFTNVPPGTYVFKVRSTNGDKVWCDNEATLTIRIRRPWWLTIWAGILYVIVAAVSLWLIRKYVRARQEEKHLFEIEVLEKQAQKEKYEAKLNFFTNIAHEFGTPLTLIACSGEQLTSNFSSKSKEGRYVRIINDSAARMQNLIQELLEFRKVESGYYEPQYTHVNPCQMLRSILDNFYEVGSRHGISSELVLPEEDITFISDPSALEKIMTNLVSNAYKYTPDGGRVDILLESKDNGIRCVVSNTSKGMSEEKLSHVFDRFVILDTFERQAGKGKMTRNGLGTALMSSLVKTLGGTISVDSVLDKSVTFEFFMPSATEDMINISPEYVHVDSSAYIAEMENEAYNDARQAVSEDMNKPLVMVVDDDIHICELVADILSASYRVLKAKDGQEALELLAAERPHLIITDMDMPNVGGLELLKRLKSNELTKFIPVVILAFKTDVDNEVNSYNLGSEAFISKPFLPQQLTAIVGNVLKNRSSLKDYYNSAVADMDLFQGSTMNSKEKAFISSFIRIVEENITDDLSPAFVAEKMCISEMTLYRRVKDIVDKKPSEFIRSIKLKKAANLLKTTDRTVQEIMFDCGFNNKSYFYRTFAQTYGMSPKEYRKSV